MTHRLGPAASILALALLTTACWTTPPPPSTPTGLTATPTRGAVELAWTDPNTDETTSRVHRAEGDADLEPLASGALDIEVDGRLRAAVDGDVHVGVRYRYGVAAVGSGGTSALAATPAPVGPLPFDDAITGRLSGYAPTFGRYALASTGVLQIDDPGGGPGTVSFGDEVQSGDVDDGGVLDIALEPLADAALQDEDWCGTEVRAAFLFTLTIATVPDPGLSTEIGAFAALTNTGARDPLTDARVGDVVGGWLYVTEAVAVEAACAAGDGTSWSYDLALQAGWNAIAVRTDAVAGGSPTERTLTSATSGDLVWATRPRAVSEGVLLEGAPESPAADAAYDLTVPLPAGLSSFIEFDDGVDHDVLRTEIDIEFAADATVAQVNAVLEEIGGRIVSMVRSTPVFVVRIPDPGSIAALDQLIADLEGRAEVVAVLKSLLLEPDQELRPQALPGGIDATDLSAGGDIERVDHHLAVRAHGAWNLRELIPELADRPWLVIGDWFGDGAPDGDYAAVVDADDYGTQNADDHGYHVLGIAIGAYGPGPGDADRDDVTGMFPATLNVRAADYSDGATANRIRNLLMQRINDVLDDEPDARIVVNTSLGFTADPGTGVANAAARTWIAMVRNNDLEDRFLHLTSAGNGGSTAVVQRNSIFTFAALGNVTDADGGAIANLTNVLAIENRTNTFTAGLDRPMAGCASSGSTMGGHLSAIGEIVWSFGSNATAAGASDMSGTSMATPQVAGLAAYVWSIDPTLSPQEVAAILSDTSRAMVGATTNTNWTCNTITAQPVIDALDALLAVGGERARRSLMNLSEGSPDVFDHVDLEILFQQMPDTPTLDYGRTDLNGDGISDPNHVSTRTERLDLDGDGVFGVLNEVLGGEPVVFDETALTDLQVACYFAYSPLYGGSARTRSSLLGTELLVAIAGPRTRYVPLESDGAGGWTVDDVTLLGGVTPPRCTRDVTVQPSELEWLDESSIPLGTGGQYTLTGAAMQIGPFDAYAARTLTLRYVAGGGLEAQSLVTVVPCARSGDGVEGYPECPLLIGDLAEILIDTFGRIPTDIEAEVARAIHEIPAHRDVLDALGFPLCDPTFCDPFPPGFPNAQVDLRAGFYADRGETIVGFLDQLFEALDATSLAEFDGMLDALQRAVASEAALSNADRELFAAAAAVVQSGVGFFAPASAGGDEGWTAFAFVDDPDALVDHVPVLAPARRGLEGFLTSVVVRNARSGFATELDLNAATYAMTLEAFDQASIAAQEGF